MKMLQRVTRTFVGDIWTTESTTEKTTEKTTEPTTELPTARTIHKKMNRIRKEAAK